MMEEMDFFESGGLYILEVLLFFSFESENE
jgi:hypothetical protein